MVRLFECLIDGAYWVVYPCGQCVIFYGRCVDGFPVKTSLEALLREEWHGTVREVTP
jgi:hypothetical protein